MSTTPKTSKCKICTKRYKLAKYVKYTPQELETCFSCITLIDIVRIYEKQLNEHYLKTNRKAEIKLNFEVRYTGGQV
jgi:hypothetical protein